MNETLTEEPQTESICSEEYFHRTLVLERKRTERTGRPFLLVFLDVGELLSDRGGPAEALMETLARTLEATTRDIDVKGWYRRNAVLGIICTEVARSAMDPVVAKIKKRLVAAFGSDGVRRIKMLLIRYPELEQGPGNASRAIPIPELRPERKGMFYS